MHSWLKAVLVPWLVCTLSSCDLFDDSDSNTATPSNPAFACQNQNASKDQAELLNQYTLFESGHVRPLALSPDGQRLYVINTPNNCLEVYATDDTLTPVAAVPVGLEPVAVAAPSNDEVWVVNHLSDSVSIIDMSGVPRVKATLWVGDEPNDIVFAGKEQQRAFITSAYRGQNHPSFQANHLRENGHGRADVWVFDRTSLGAGAGGTPLTIVNLFADVPRALAVSTDGATVYAAAFMSGNRSTVIEESALLPPSGFIVLGYYQNEAGGDLSLEQMEAITGFSPDSFGMTEPELIQFGIDMGILTRIEHRLVVNYRNSPVYRINNQGQVVNQITSEVLSVEVPAGVELIAALDLPPYVPETRSKPAPTVNSEGLESPNTGLIVKYDGSAWRDENGTDWSDKINFSLPDYDIFSIDAAADLPQEKSHISQVGTTLFNMAVNPVSGKLYVSNLDSHNEVRFEGPGLMASTVRGNIAQSRISVIENGSVVARNLNKHLTHTEAQGEAIAPGEKAKTLSQPMQMAVSADGADLYVAAMGSNKVGIFQTRALEQDSFLPDAANQILLPASGPTGVALNTSGNRLYVTTRFDNSIHVIDTKTKQVLASRAMFSPEPQTLIEGRRFLYDADLTSANGENACASCHLFGDLDALAWDLGNPDASSTPAPINSETPALSPSSSPLHPMKGPMSTQTLRGIADHGPMHWRGDRTGDSPAVINGQMESREAAAFKAFNPAFVSLLGRETQLEEKQMQAFTDFALKIMPPPNPIRNLDNSLTNQQQQGHQIYMNQSTTAVGSCNACHEVDAEKNRFGSNTTVTFEGGRVSQDFKVAQLRNAYTKVGRFDDGAEQIRGFGFLHDGSEPTLLRFLNAGVFSFSSDAQRNLVADFVFAMDTNLPPIVGQQVTVNENNREAALVRLDLLLARAELKECDLVASAVIRGAQQQLMLNDAEVFVARSGATVSKQALLEKNLPATFTCYPPGNGKRILQTN